MIESTLLFLGSVLQLLDKVIAIARLVVYHSLVCIRNARKLLSMLIRGTQTWVIMLFRLLTFTVILAPGWYQLLRYWLFNPFILRNVEYGQGAKARNVMDIYLPIPPSRGSARGNKITHLGVPVVIFVSGGAWIIGYKLWSALVGRGLAAMGIMTVVPDYRNFPQGDIEDMMRDVRQAILWTADNISRFGGDPHKIILAGQSAGAHICLSLLTRDYIVRKTASPLHQILLSEEEIIQSTILAVDKTTASSTEEEVDDSVEGESEEFKGDEEPYLPYDVSPLQSHSHVCIDSTSSHSMERWHSPLCRQGDSPDNKPRANHTSCIGEEEEDEEGEEGHDFWNYVKTPQTKESSESDLQEQQVVQEKKEEVTNSIPLVMPTSPNPPRTTVSTASLPTTLLSQQGSHPSGCRSRRTSSNSVSHFDLDSSEESLDRIYPSHLSDRFRSNTAPSFTAELPPAPSAPPATVESDKVGEEEEEISVLPLIRGFIGVSGPYNLLSLQSHLHGRGLDASILSWICRGDLAQYSPTAQLAALAKRLDTNPSPSNTSDAFAASPLINLDPPEERRDESLHSSCPDAPMSHLASSTGVTELTSEVEKVDSQISYAQSVDYRLHVKVGDDNEISRGNPLADFPPVALFHGSLDRSIPLSISNDLHQVLLKELSLLSY
eukprot:scaffold5412_cov171-Ochromonas_danica.AAC.2